MRRTSCCGWSSSSCRPRTPIARFRGREQDTDLTEDLLRERVQAFPYTDGALRLDTTRSDPKDLAAAVRDWLRIAPASIDRTVWVEAGRNWN